VADWIRKNFDAYGLTQAPPGPHLGAIQAAHGGAVVLCLDVSGSMGGRIGQAVAGCQTFVDEALGAGYSVSVLLWDDAIRGRSDLTRDRAELTRLLASASAGGGTTLTPALDIADSLLTATQAGDRVVAIFSDGFLGDPDRARVKSQELSARGIRVLTRGLGDAAALALASLSTETFVSAQVATESTIGDSIASMASALRRGRPS
jgi:uncharacterized protein (DUF58 family)